MTRSLEAATTWPDHREREAGVDLHGRVALVTGGGRGVGRLLARTLAEAGAAVALIARSSDELATTVGQIRDAGAVAAAASADVTDEIAVTAALAQLRAQLGPVDILINNAGINGPMGVMWETESAEWWRTLEVNLGGAFVLSRMLLPDMIAAGRGRIINITSNAGVYRWPLVSAYVTSKAALIKLTETLAAETVKHGVSVFSVDPGLLPIGLKRRSPDEHRPARHAGRTRVRLDPRPAQGRPRRRSWPGRAAHPRTRQRPRRLPIRTPSHGRR
jgi:NAD(P)-dependent dehydrogenase (short-subunit alcohol dehydrogenase family)